MIIRFQLNEIAAALSESGAYLELSGSSWSFHQPGYPGPWLYSYDARFSFDVNELGEESEGIHFDTANDSVSVTSSPFTLQNEEEEDDDQPRGFSSERGVSAGDGPLVVVTNEDDMIRVLRQGRTAWSDPVRRTRLRRGDAAEDPNTGWQVVLSDFGTALVPDDLRTGRRTDGEVRKLVGEVVNAGRALAANPELDAAAFATLMQSPDRATQALAAGNPSLPVSLYAFYAEFFFDEWWANPGLPLALLLDPTFREAKLGLARQRRVEKLLAAGEQPGSPRAA